MRLEEGSVPEHHYFQVGVSEEEWNEITQPFFEMVENNAIPLKTLEAVFGELLDEDTKG